MHVLVDGDGMRTSVKEPNDEQTEVGSWYRPGGVGRVTLTRRSFWLKINETQ